MGKVAGHLWAVTLYRMDAWGVAIIVGLLAVIIHDAYRVDAVILLATIGFAYWFGYIVNDYFDAPDDAQDQLSRHRNFFVHVPIGRVAARTSFAAGCALVLAGFGIFGAAGAVACVVSVAVLWSYSAPPVRLKSRPGADLVTHALFVQTYPYLLFMWLLELDWTATDGLIVAVNFLASLSGQLAQQIRDFDVDARTARTFATTVGLDATRMALVGTSIGLGVIVLYGFLSQVLPLYLLPVVLFFAPTFVGRIRGIGTKSRRFAVASTTLTLLYVSLLVYRGVAG